MNKHLTTFILLGITALFSSCAPDAVFYPEWIGEYAIKSIKTYDSDGCCTENLIEEGKIRYIYPDGYIEEQERDFENYPPLSIFNDKGLYVQTLGIGDPFIPHVDPENHVLIARSPTHKILKNDSAEDEPIDSVTTTVESVIVLMNGMVFTIYNGLTISPNPIKVARASSDSLVLQNGKQFDIVLTNADGSIAEQAHNYWKYGPLKKENDIYTFDAELYSYIDGREQPYIFRHHLIFHKK